MNVLVVWNEKIKFYSVGPLNEEIGNYDWKWGKRLKESKRKNFYLSNQVRLLNKMRKRENNKIDFNLKKIDAYFNAYLTVDSSTKLWSFNKKILMVFVHMRPGDFNIHTWVCFYFLAFYNTGLQGDSFTRLWYVQRSWFGPSWRKDACSTGWNTLRPYCFGRLSERFCLWL